MRLTRLSHGTLPTGTRLAAVLASVVTLASVVALGAQPAAAMPPAVIAPATLAPATIAPAGMLQPARSACEQAGRQAETAAGLPQGLLLAIGRVESGRYSATLGRVAPWPWTVDIAGTGVLFATRAAALTAVRTALASGQSNIDAGCFQVNFVPTRMRFPISAPRSIRRPTPGSPPGSSPACTPVWAPGRQRRQPTTRKPPRWPARTCWR